MSEDIPLHPIEKSILNALSGLRQEERLDLQELARQSNLTLDQVRRGIEWLKAKKLIAITQHELIILSLGDLGREALKNGLPERKLAEIVRASGGIKLPELAKKMGEEFQVAFGLAKKNGWIKIDHDSIRFAESWGEPEELVLEKISGKGKLSKNELSKEELSAVESLRKRRDGFVLSTKEKTVQIQISEAGRRTALTLSAKEIDAITPQVLQTGEWKKFPLRAIDVTSPSPNYYVGRKHPMRMFMDEVRETFVSLGFEEISGPMSQSSLWNFDALFIPQQHSAREMQDTFYLSNMKARLDSFKQEVAAIKDAHEKGGGTGSLGWQYEWKEEEASRVVLRTHTTAVTISYLSKYKPDEARVFSVGRVFRNEKPNYKHNPEFFQIEGIMVGEKLNLRNLIFMISKFYSKLGFNEIKFWPTYFPYTEPSLQTMVFHKETGKWMELGGMGVFRPEVTLPLGVRNPVLAWGLGLDRLVMLKYGIGDVRQLYGANLDWLREQKVL